jgi:DNA-binding MarR family transcriptional regulator
MSDHADPWLTAVAALQLGNRVIDEIQAGVIAAGFDDVTPLHGFAFARIAAGGASTADLASHLGVSKQAAAQLTERLVQAGYVSREAHPRDQRSRLLTLTARGQACTRAARRAAEAAVRRWRTELPSADIERFESSLLKLTASISTLRPPS